MSELVQVGDRVSDGQGSHGIVQRVQRVQDYDAAGRKLPVKELVYVLWGSKW